jgi:hypothetical protein
MKLIRVIAAIAAAVPLSFAFTAGARAAYLDGQTLTFAQYYPNTTTVAAGPFTVTVGAGVEANIPGYGTVDVSDSGLLIKFAFPANSQWVAAPFNGFIVDIPGALPALTGVTFGPATSPEYLTGATIAYSAHSFSVNWAGLPIETRTVELQLSTAAVPEPESLALMLAGLCVIGVTAARRTKSA